jgi:hypothetical protein
MPDQHRRSAWTHWLVPAVVVLVAAVLIIVILVPGKQEEAPEEGGLATEGTGVEAPTEIQGPEEPDLSEAERRVLGLSVPLLRAVERGDVATPDGARRGR